MSRIGKQTINIPQGVDVTVDGVNITVKGPKGELKRAVSPLVSVVVADGILTVSLQGGSSANNIWGLTRALLANMIKGVSVGFEKTLEFSGVGYKAQLKGNDLELNLGFSHPISVKAPEGIIFKAEKSSIQISGINNELVGHVAANIRKFRPPEPYQGSGIKYKGEVIIRKAGKKAASST